MDVSNLFPQAISPSAYQIGQYGRTPVSYFHGLPQISVPLTEVRGRGFILPVSLSYHGGGIKPEQHPGWVGLGWSLHAGGCITRVIHGIKDEMVKREYDSYHSYACPRNPGYLHHMSELQSSAPWSESLLYEKMSQVGIDYEPDEYIVSAPGISASFVIVGEHEIRVISRDESAITLECFELADDNYRAELNLYPGMGYDEIKAKRFCYIRKIVLKDQHGNRYVFGGTDDAIEYSITQHPIFAPNSPTIVNTRNWDAVATANTWMLTRLERADGEVFVFSYSRDGVPIVLRDNHCGWQYSGDNSSPRPLRTYWPLPWDMYDTYEAMKHEFKANLNFHFLMPSYLCSIECTLSGDHLDFVRERTTELGYDFGRDDFENDFSTYVADLTEARPSPNLSYAEFRSRDYYCKLVRIVGECRDVRLSYRESDSERLKLTDVHIVNPVEGQTSEGSYSFTYNATPLPRYNSRETDRWGYYNGHCYESLLEHFGHGLDSDRSPSAEHMAAEMLIQVHYPTGGWTDFEWEPHSYATTVLPPAFLVETMETPRMAGGLRIKSITDHHAADGDGITRIFSYEESGISKGVLSDKGRSEASGIYSFMLFSDVLTGHFSMYSELPILPLSETDGSHVTYSLVREVFQDGGYVEYRYLNHENPLHRDSMSDIMLGNGTESPLYGKIVSAAISRGLLWNKKLCNRDGIILTEETLEYDSPHSMSYATAAKDIYSDDALLFLSYSQVPCGYPSLRSRVVTERCDDGSLIVDSYEYTYNHDRLMTTEAHRRSSRGASPETMSEETRYFYPADRPGPDHDDMVSEGFRGLVLGIARLRDGLVVDAQEREYVIRHIPALPSERTVVIVGLAMRPVWLACRSYSARLDSPVTIDSYADSPMSCMQSTPDIEVKGFDGHASPLFAGMKDGSASEMVWSLRHGEPCMSIRTADRVIPPGVSSTRHQILVNYQDIVSKDFITDAPSTFRCDMTPDYGYALHAMVTIDGTTYHLAQWSRPEAPDAIWQSLISLYQASLCLPIDSGRHTMSVRLLDWRGTSGSSETVGGSVVVTHATPATYSPESFFVDLDVESESGEGFHCGHGHEGPLTVNRSIPSGRSYILDYMERQAGGDWHYMRTAYNGGNVTIGGTGRTVSNVRIYPEGSMPESYSYREFVGMTAKTDARGVSESYGYDSLGRLSEVRDNDGNIMSGSSYTFATAGGGSGTDNTVESRLFTSEDGSSSRLTVSHMDGLGRPVQEAIVDGGGEGRDIITRKEYDNVGRELRNLVPTPSDADDEDFSDDARWTENEYEESPRDRILSVMGPGQAWRDADKKVTTLLYANSATVPELMHRGFSVTDSDGNPLTAGRRLLRNSGLTPDGLLNVTKTITEDEEVTLVFSDVHGEEVLTRRILTDAVTGDVTYADTHTVRDALGRIAAVIPPKLIAQMESSDASQWSYSAIEGLAFLYRYDGRGNCIEKNIPGGGWTYMAYDKGGRCIFTQDAVQREEGRWAFRLVDILGRECVTGTVVRSMDVSADPIASRNIYVSMPASPDYVGSLKGYDLNGISSLGTDVRILTVCYYDGYGFNEGSTMTAYSEPAAGEPYGRMGSHPVTGLLTGRLARVLDGTDSETFLRDVMYYDDKARVIQRCSTTMFGRADRESLGYDFAGNVVARKLVHGKPSSLSTYTEKLTCSYDAMGRPLETTHRSGTAAVRVIASREYDAVGRLASVGRAGQTMTALQQSYSYNIRSWLTGISGDLFTEVIRHEDSSTPRWDGKISETSWRNPGETSDRGYVYRYDGLARLTAAEYADASGSGLFTERYGYDLNGNMTSKAKTVQINNGLGNVSSANMITHKSYTGNRMRSIPLETVTYDACGRLTGASSGKVRSTRYNEIGLPQEMTLSDGSTVNVVYAADGRKLRERVTSGSSSVIRNYSGNCIFEGSVLKKVLFEGGYAQMSGNTPTYMFFLTDHLGSVRVVADENGTVRQVNQYYPYGDLIEDANMIEWMSDNRYRFTGKELATETGLYDFMARYLETSMGRFTTIDPLAEKYPSISPYAYCAGDPVNFVDPDGRIPSPDEHEKYQDIDRTDTDWDIIENVIPPSLFIGWNSRNVSDRTNCLSLAKAQLMTVNYTFGGATESSNMYPYNESSGVNLDDLKKAISYLKSALSDGIPVLIGVDNQKGSVNLDKTTDHFLVVVGMGHDSKGNYLRVYDNATSDQKLGTSSDNKLYFDSERNVISGRLPNSYSQDLSHHPYILSQVRESKYIGF